MTIKRIEHFSPEDLKDINKLLLQLSSRGYQMKEDDFKTALKDKNIFLLGLFEDKRIIGTATLVALHQVTGYKGYVEDVVVDEKYRGQGLGKRLMKEIIAEAQKLKLFRLELKSETDRVAANKLYQALGFNKKEANVYQYKL